MEWVFIILSVFGFTTWAFFQIGFVRSSFNPDTSSRLFFPIIVPILSSIIVCFGYWIYFKHAPIEVFVKSFQNTQNWKFLLFSSSGLALGYIMYTLAISFPDNNNAAIITALNVVFITFVLFFFRYENDRLISEIKVTLPQIIGGFLTIIGVLLMKYGNTFFNK